MNFDYSEMQQMLLDSAERLMKARGEVEQWRERRHLADGLDAAGWAQFAELGWLMLPISEEAGGLGGSMEDVALLMTALGKGLATEPYISTAVLGAYLIEKTASPKREELLTGIAGGEVRIALAHAEIGDRYDIDTPRATKAVRDGDGYRIDGAKSVIFDAPSATHLIVSADLADAGTALFLVEGSAESFLGETFSLVDGTQAADLRFKGLSVGADALLASSTDATELLFAATDRAAVATVAQAVGSMEACLDLCSAYMKERRQFGQPIGNFQSLQHMIVDMLVATHQSRSAMYGALAAMDGDVHARARAVSAAKIVMGEASQVVMRNGVQIHGGYGVTDEYAISHHYRRLLSLEKAYGDIGFHVTRLAASHAVG
jgi:alkylation response protein AidB-like acyl-CoA dehydrogenase